MPRSAVYVEPAARQRMSDLRDQLQISLGTTYTLEHELGGGGMSRVFVAHDAQLGRKLVVKVLSPELAAGVNAERFKREIRVVASLQQANIVPLLSAGETNGLPFYTMPFVEGRSLRDRLSRDTRLPLADAVSILRDVARALTYAHEHGVVHRDIKPENVLLSGEAAVVTDFGIARALASAMAEVGDRRSETITQIGTALGTPAYMAPEQIAADASADHRADLYSFGCLAYELLAGETPFAGRNAQQLLAAHLGERPTPLGERCPECPASISALVMRCLEKEASARPQSARELLLGLETTTVPATGLARLRNRLTTRQRRGGMIAIAAAIIAAVIVPARSWLGAGADPDRIESLAIIPFTNVGGDTAQEYLAQGMANELTTALGKIHGIRVVSRTLSARYRGRPDLDAQEVGRALDVRYLVLGTLRRAGGQLNVSTQLIRADDNTEAWSEDFSGRADDAFAVQDSIMRAITNTLQRGQGGATASSSVASIGTTNPQAYDLYMVGKMLLDRRGTGVVQSVERFEQAIRRDSTFARPYATLAVALAHLPYFTPTPAATLRDSVIRTAQRALALDSTQAEAHTALALAYSNGYEWDRALAAHIRAIALDSSDALTHMLYGRLLFNLRRFREASAELDRARRLDPYSAVVSAWNGHLLSVTGRNAEGLAELERAMEIDSVNTPGMFMLPQALLKAGLRDSAKVVTDRLVRTFPAWKAAAGVLYGLLGERAVAESTYREIAASTSVVGERFSTMAMIALALRDTSRALDVLERATDAREIWPVWGALGSSHFDPVVGSPRFSALLRRVGLDERIFRSN